MTQPLHTKFQYPGLDSGDLMVEFDVEMHNRRSDFTVLRNSFFHGEQTSDRGDSPLMRHLVTCLMADKHASVVKITVKNFSLIVHHSRAVSLEYMKEVIRQACTEQGYAIIDDHRRKPGNPWKGARVSELDHPMAVAEVLARSLARHNAEQDSGTQA